jgi:hypothetical protein
MRQHRRSSYLKVPQTVELERLPIKIWAYAPSGEFVCRLEINGAGLAAYSGTKGGKRLCNVVWERLVQQLSEE